MYRFINEFNTHKIIEGSEGMRDWYKCNKKARKSICRYAKICVFNLRCHQVLTDLALTCSQYHLKNFSKEIFEQLTDILERNIGPSGAMGHWGHPTHAYYSVCRLNRLGFVESLLLSKDRSPSCTAECYFRCFVLDVRRGKQATTRRLR
jgi:hypothetical protein